MERAFNFKLLVPPRASLAQVSAVKPQDSGLFEESNKTSLPFSNTNMVLPTKSPKIGKKVHELILTHEILMLQCNTYNSVKICIGNNDSEMIVKTL
uniref:Uncharacterized protein n=1 Tax=Pygocentrus nattereri TaxID=42514 RepID=A0A3B4BUI4_PYGNA